MSRLLPPGAQLVTARLAGAGSVRSELEAVLNAASPDAGATDYRCLVVEKNVAGKATEVTRDKTWRRLRERYVMDPDVEEFLAFRTAMQSTTAPSDRGLLCFLMFARTERLFRDVTLACVSPLLARPDSVVQAAVVHQAVEEYVRESGTEWTPVTTTRVRQHILSTLKDYGLLKGSVNKRTQATRPGHAVVTFAASLGRLEGLTDRQIIDGVWFRLLGLRRDEIVDYLYSAAQHGALGFRMQADVVELTLRNVEGAA